VKLREPRGRYESFSRNCRKDVEEVPKGGTIGNSMADGATDENTVSEFSDLNGHDGGGMGGVTDFVVEREEFLKGRVDIRRRQEVGDREIVGGGVDEIDAGVVACDVDVAVGMSFESAS